MMEILTVSGEPDLGPWVRVSAEDAPLIKAAPKMLAALKAMAEAHYDQPIGAWFHVIRTAIAEATGNTPHE